MEQKKRAERNRTLTILPQEEEVLKKNIETLETVSRSKDFINKTVNANLMDVLPLIPDGFANLIIIDPPYNLTKDFNGMKFNAMKEDRYEAYLDSWLPLVCKN